MTGVTAAGLLHGCSHLIVRRTRTLTWRRKPRPPQIPIPLKRAANQLQKPISHPANHCLRLPSLSREACAVLTRVDERLHHLGLLKVSVKLVELVEPELVAIRIGVAP